MSIATKNGSVILKSGIVAEGCGCCGGWYCCAQQCPVSALNISSITIGLSASDYIQKRKMLGIFASNRFWTSGYLGSVLSGSHVLLAESESATNKVFGKTFFPLGGNGCDYGVSVTVSDPTPGRPYQWVNIYISVRYFYILSNSQFYTSGDFRCQSEFPTGQSPFYGFSPYTNINKLYAYNQCDAVGVSAFAPHAEDLYPVALDPGLEPNELVEETGSPTVSIASLDFVIS